WQKILAEAHLVESNKLATYHIELGRLYGNFVNNFTEKYKIQADFIASHGHTVIHQPDKGITLQIGDGKTIAATTGIKVVCDFRKQDVDLGGQGAPLVPVGDWLLFPDYYYCLNLGGFANISYEINSDCVAFDICPVNTVLNYLANLVGLTYDDRGKFASKGHLIPELYDKLNTLTFYHKKGPKTLGKEWLMEEFIPILNDDSSNVENKLATVIWHIAEQIKIATLYISAKDILITGGGAYNRYLIEQIKKKVSHHIIIPDDILIQFKEAMIFAFLGVLRLRNEVNCLKSVTGARRNHCSGIVFQPD
ncbi:anhydro-N-acetylmuramic acid kinase, partial [candidate division KSB1 bacterium]